eukprot:CAMPEP_0174827796 /NCGR_PEP_ID=MMETSP1114-20130205/935_1 /TAXON_ID=312471 /ORGANISM="Neobodo designis, Strain CCAP 1951/1" /LENGTH=77 /DNA_ID=CAMNT_0016061473 /DNA_START=87 /DNA_END=320 /DNA_ORIENTATION=-
MAQCPTDFAPANLHVLEDLLHVYGLTLDNATHPRRHQRLHEADARFALVALANTLGEPHTHGDAAVRPSSTKPGANV